MTAKSGWDGSSRACYDKSHDETKNCVKCPLIGATARKKCNVLQATCFCSSDLFVWREDEPSISCLQSFQRQRQWQAYRHNCLLRRNKTVLFVQQTDANKLPTLFKKLGHSQRGEKYNCEQFISCCIWRRCNVIRQPSLKNKNRPLACVNGLLGSQEELDTINIWYMLPLTWKRR